MDNPVTNKDADLYNQVIAVTNDYLGPATERFIERQIKLHLNKRPDELTREDVVKLADWIKISIALLTEDSKTVNDFTNSLLELTKPRSA